jgi:hypothetical protein
MILWPPFDAETVTPSIGFVSGPWWKMVRTTSHDFINGEVDI